MEGWKLTLSEVKIKVGSRQINRHFLEKRIIDLFPSEKVIEINIWESESNAWADKSQLIQNGKLTKPVIKAIKTIFEENCVNNICLYRE